MILIDILLGKKASKVPFWFMRQAGRYLPEYKKVRATFPNFLEFCYTPEAACEVTLQPISRFDMSAAIIFSDILVIPDAMGMNVRFEENVGPLLDPIQSGKDIDALSFNTEKLTNVYKAISLTRQHLAKDKALIGFCGAPWTLSCYMLQGKSSADFAQAKEFSQKAPDNYKKLQQLLVEAVAKHACRQIEAGANAIQLFDSWSGVLSEAEFASHVVAPTKEIVTRIKSQHPDIPIIGFPRMCGEKLAMYAKETKVDAVSFDGSVSLEYAQKEVQPYAVLQGNLNSQVFAEDKETALQKTRELLDRFAGTPFIFNLAHGILPHTPIENVQAVSDMIKTRL